MPLKLTNTNAAYNGRTAGTQCLSRTHSVFSRTSGQDAPTADARRLFAPTAFPKKANCEEFAFRFIWEGPTEAKQESS